MRKIDNIIDSSKNSNERTFRFTKLRYEIEKASKATNLAKKGLRMPGKAGFRIKGVLNFLLRWIINTK